MKRSGILFVIATFVFAVFIQMSQTEIINNDTETNLIEEYNFPKKVKAVIEKSCFGCHSEKGSSDDAKDALRWDKMYEYDKAKLVAILDEIIEVVEEQEMPPKKFIAKNPDKKPTDKDYKILAKWADKEAEKIMK